MNYRTLLFLAFQLFIQSGDLCWGQNLRCINTGNYTRNSTFAVNLNNTFSILSRDMTNNGFSNASAGMGPDIAYAAALCGGDAQLDQCKNCIRKVSDELLQRCNQKQAIRWSDGCTLRYSNNTIYGELETWPVQRWWNTGKVSSPFKFEDAVRGLLDGLREKAASGGSLRKVAAGEVRGPDFQTIYAMVRCTPDLSEEECTNCLLSAYGDIPKHCDGTKGCQVLFPSCTLRFESYSFYNKTRLEELGSLYFPPPPPAPVPPPGVDPTSSRSEKGGGNNKTRNVVIIVVPIILSLILAVFLVIWLRKKTSHKPLEFHYQNVDEISTAESLQYPFSTIKSATNDFSIDKKLGQGGFGSVYKGKLPNGLEIAVKRLSMNSGQGHLEFKNEVLLLAKLQHRNLVKLLGFAIEGMEKILIYELVQNASLDQFIFDERIRSNLDWDIRYKIIGGIARGILYLHEDSRLRIIHRDLKASNILLDGEMNPKIADFGMARLFGQEETQAKTSRIVGTYGYMPPEYMIHGQFSNKSDVFSFGVLVLEIISRRRNTNFQCGENIKDLLSFAWKKWREGRAVDVVDDSLRSGSGSMNEMLRCIHISLLCVQENAALRPTMASVVIMLTSHSMSLNLPSEPAFYVSTSRDPKRPADQSDHSSQNDISISDLYPR